MFRKLLHPKVRHLSRLGQHENRAMLNGAECPLQLAEHPVAGPDLDEGAVVPLELVEGVPAAPGVQESCSKIWGLGCVKSDHAT